MSESFSRFSARSPLRTAWPRILPQRHLYPDIDFDPCVTEPAVVADKYQSVAFDRNRYSVPRPFAFQTVTVKGYVDRVAIVAEGQIVATHPRCFERQKMILEPIHYLATLGRKPGALDHSPVFRDWKLPTCFADLRSALEEVHGSMAGARRFVQVLQLLGEHPLIRVRQAVEECSCANLVNAEAVIERTRSLAAIEALTRNLTLPRAESSAAAVVQIPIPDLSRFDQLLFGSASRGDSNTKEMKNTACDAQVAEPGRCVLQLTRGGVIGAGPDRRARQNPVS